MPRKKRQRRNFPDEQKFKMVTAIIKGEEPLSAIARQYDVHTTQLSAWKKEFMDNGHLNFSSDKKAKEEKTNLKKSSK